MIPYSGSTKSRSNGMEIKRLLEAHGFFQSGRTNHDDRLSCIEHEIRQLKEGC
jgi:hypothetical protein